MATTYRSARTSVPGRRPRRRRRLWAIPLVIVLLAASASALVAASTPNAPTGGDRAGRAASFVGKQLEASAVPAASYAVIENGRMAASGAVGEGIAADTPFMVGSLSKSFTALAIMQQVDEGTIALDDPVTRHIPWFRTADPDAVITVRHLLDQTSGLPTSAGTADLNSPHLTLEQRVRAVVDVELAGAPGETFRYCNKNYATLGLLLERVTGRSYAEYVQERIFAPLEMHDSYTDMAAAERAGLVSGSASWFGASIDRDTDAYPGALPDGYLISTAEDLTHFLRAQIDGTFEGRRIVSERSVELMHSASAKAELYPKRDHYGFGWATGELHGRPAVSHAGQLPNYYAELALLPGQGDGMVVLNARHALFGDTAAPRIGAMEILAGGDAPELSRGFVLTTVWFDAAVLGLLALLVVVIAGGVGRLRRIGERIAAEGTGKAVLRPGLGWLAAAAFTWLAVFLGMGSGSFLPLAIAYDYAPDLTATVLATVGVLAARGVAVLIGGFAAQRRLRHRPPAPRIWN